MTRPRLNLDEEGWLRVITTGVTVAALAVCAGFLGAPPALIAAGLAVLAGAPAVWLWHRHLDDLTNRRTLANAPVYDQPHPAADIRPAVDRAV
jgi:hypothetical protein